MDGVTNSNLKITVIRQEMAGFLTGIAIFEENSNRAFELQKTLDDYVERYKRLTPLLNVVNQDLKLQIPPKQEPQLKPSIPISTTNTNTNTANSNAPNTANNKNTTTTQQPKKPQRKRTYTKKKDQNNQNNQKNININQPPPAPTNNNAPILPNTNGSNGYQTSANIIGFQPFQGNNNNSTDAGSENQPIML
ncbi:Translation initiation factor IF-2 [Wickerhamomyces ciferrii]|uniref:Translation initiation factor IF-2 n=1 Tax=Wickerhamomyces ciferrii (strain ATCC 14091 / BCRC 22168 / CBS 111 / JCM 3599 / NBRC 0793 / NRRL Y-1031 F-60-10) TaxID=1206466 RepID=K0K9D2_WICCF|nr:Translation initiation factor IF-2 [Wickerhamomyces ciferrii]CCH41520.1 Translation initiation factor IF-2 [Wickerhamomyces ciferrii]